jgi:ATP-dependent Clp protease protease subunit
MKSKIDLFTPKTIKNTARDDDFTVFWAKTDDGIEVFLYGVVGDEYTQTDAASVAKVLSANKNAPVTMRVNSFGGLAFDGLAIFNALADHSGPTLGIIESVAASAASLAVIGADKVQMQANAIYHIHEGLALGYGHIADLKETIDWLEKFNAAAVATYAAKTGKSENVLASALLGENGDGTKYTAQQALEMGFIDEILPMNKKAAKAQVNSRSGELAARARILRAKSH